MRDFRRLSVWERGHELALASYRHTSRFPRSEQFGLRRQIRRAAASIPANIAEGCGRRGSADFARFLTIAMGSAKELEYHLLLARELELLSERRYAELNALLLEVQRMLRAFVLRLEPRMRRDVPAPVHRASAG